MRGVLKRNKNIVVIIIFLLVNSFLFVEQIQGNPYSFYDESIFDVAEENKKGFKITVNDCSTTDNTQPEVVYFSWSINHSSWNSKTMEFRIQINESSWRYEARIEERESEAYYFSYKFIASSLGKNYSSVEKIIMHGITIPPPNIRPWYSIYSYPKYYGIIIAVFIVSNALNSYRTNKLLIQEEFKKKKKIKFALLSLTFCILVYLIIPLFFIRR